jgi:hypothetical protein
MAYEFKGRTRDRVAAESGGRPARTSSERAPRSRSDRQPMQAFAATVGGTFLLVGIAGFIPGLTSNYDELEFAGPDSGAKLFGLFETSIVHNIVHLLFAVGLIAAARYSWSRLYLLAGGVAYLGVLLYGLLIEHDSEANFLPVNDADNVLHLGLGVAMIALGVIGTRLARDSAGAR